MQGAIARAARSTGANFRYLVAQAQLESSLDPAAHATSSSAAGLYQFTTATWLETLSRHGAAHGLGWAQQAIANGQYSDPAMRLQVLNMRYDADASALMAAELANDNRDGLVARLGREPDAAELYLAHFLGLSGAGQFLSALDADPGQSAVTIVPRAAASNPSIFYENGSARSLASVMSLMRDKVSQAMMEEGGTGMSSPVHVQSVFNGTGYLPSSPFPGPIAREFHMAGAAAQTAVPVAPSMATMLDSILGASDAVAPAHVRAAYDKLARMGL